jgi:hypothetical protein
MARQNKPQGMGTEQNGGGARISRPNTESIPSFAEQVSISFTTICLLKKGLQKSGHPSQI